MTSPATVVEELARIWNSQDEEAIPAIFAPDAVFEDMAFAVRREGLVEIRDMMGETWRGIPDLNTEIARLVGEGEWVASEWTLTGTHSGDFPDLPATGRCFLVRGVSITHVREGKIASQRDYYDRAGFLEQLGVHPGEEQNDDI